MGVIYLIHFAEPYKHARHYIGYASNLKRRIERHRSGNGARLLVVVQDAGIEWNVVRQWKGDKALERRLKGRGAARHCPVCRNRYLANERAGRERRKRNAKT